MGRSFFRLRYSGMLKALEAGARRRLLVQQPPPFGLGCCGCLPASALLYRRCRRAGPLSRPSLFQGFGKSLAALGRHTAFPLCSGLSRGLRGHRHLAYHAGTIHIPQSRQGALDSAFLLFQLAHNLCKAVRHSYPFYPIGRAYPEYTCTESHGYTLSKNSATRLHLFLSRFCGKRSDAFFVEIALRGIGQCKLVSSGCGAAWLARLLGVQEVPGSNPGSPTKFLIDLQPGKPSRRGVWSPSGVPSARFEGSPRTPAGMFWRT